MRMAHCRQSETWPQRRSLLGDPSAGQVRQRRQQTGQERQQGKQQGPLKALLAHQWPVLVLQQLVSWPGPPQELPLGPP